MAEHVPHPANTAGDFYVEDGCCTMCEVPFVEAPGLFGVSKDEQGYPHCYVQRQPATSEQLAGMISAIRCSEVQCIRYRGSDRVIQLQLVEAAEGPQCDQLPEDLQKRSDKAVAARQEQIAKAERNRRQGGG
ncbi:hypothetical protein AYO44_05070 [Planctomycetaceae bacterium SCGC AG-212-F19]|nr:hypothetical protein AYO44_05070 [Planctomycetaceae bacterium SCGC AG-212-F19]